jgi:hypothetical protein
VDGGELSSLVSLPTNALLARASIAASRASSVASNASSSSSLRSPSFNSSRGGGGGTSGRHALLAPPPQLPMEVFEYLRDRLEAYVMTRLYDLTFAVAAEDVAEDEDVAARLEALGWLGPAELRIPPGAHDPLVLRCAAAELAAMNARMTPQGKMAAIMAAFGVVYRALVQAARRGGASVAAPSADDFLPATIFLVLHANSRRLMSNLAYVERFRDEQQLMGKAGYCFISVRSCVAYLMGLDAGGVAPAGGDGLIAGGAAQRVDSPRARATMDATEFAARCAQCAREPERYSWMRVGSIAGASAAGGADGADDGDDDWLPRKLRRWRD